MNLIPIRDRLHNLQLATTGKDLFVQMMPRTVIEGVLLRNPLSGTQVNYELPGYFRGEFQLIVRGADYEVCEKRITKIIAALTLDQGTRLGNQTFNYCRPHHLPVSFPLSDGNLVESNVMFDVCWSE